MLFATLLTLGAGLGIVISALGHPKIGGAILGSRSRSDDADANEGF